MLTYWIIAFVAIQIIHFLGTWKLHQIAGEKSWKAAVPFLNAITILKINNRPWWWMFVLFIPIVAPIMFAVIWADTAASFGKKKTEQKILAIVTLGFYLFYLNYIEKPKYVRSDDRKETLLSAVTFAVIVATVIHTFMIQPYTIPTGSMEKSLQVGDFLFVSKLNYGARVPETPIGLPFLQNAVPFTNRTVKSYIDKIRLPYLRFPKFEKIERNDIVVFNYPTDSINTAISRKDPYVKRCVGLPGDTLTIDNGALLIDGKPNTPPNSTIKQFSYIVVTDLPFSKRKLKKDFGFVEHYITGKNTNLYEYLFFLTDDDVEKMKGYSNVKSIEKVIHDKGLKDEHLNPNGQVNETNTIFPKNKNWNRDNFGPLYIPKKGDVVTLTNENYPQYRDIIEKYEHNTLEVKEGKLYINNIATHQYTIKQDYYWMMGDNRHNSLDSRYFGYVPADHILGKPILRWLSLEWRNKGVSPRWKRMFTPLNGDKKDPTSYTWLAGILIALYMGYSFISDRKKKKKNK